MLPSGSVLEDRGQAGRTITGERTSLCQPAELDLFLEFLEDLSSLNMKNCELGFLL